MPASSAPPASSPPPSSPPPVPKKGGGGLVLLGLLLFGGGGAAVAWKLSRTPTEPEVTEVRVETKTPEPPPPALAEAPPPPPTEEELQAVERASAPKPSGDAPKASGPAGCAGKCEGRETPELLSALRLKGGQARGCYNRALRQNSGIEGKMTVSLRVSPTGAVCSAGIASDTVGDPAVRSCVLEMFRGGKYPSPQGGCVEAAVPLNFVTKQ